MLGFRYEVVFYIQKQGKGDTVCDLRPSILLNHHCLKK